MANSTSHLDIVEVNESSKEVVLNALIDAASHALTYGRHESLCTGRVFALYGGPVFLPDGSRVEVANYSDELTASTTLYIVASKATGDISWASTTTNWNSGDYWRLYSCVTGTETVTSYTDYRRPADYNGAAVMNKPVTKTAAFTVAAHENEIICNGTGSITATLPDATTQAGRKIRIKTIANYTVISASANVAPLTSATAGTAILAATAGKWAELVSDGTNWVIMAGN
jgi:hypothetical protein